MNEVAVDLGDAKALIEQACEALGRHAQGQITLRVEGGDPIAELPQLRLRLKGGRKDYVYAFHPIPVVTQVVLVKLLGKRVELDGKLLITKYLNKKLADQLQGAGIRFLDTVGNAYIADPGIFLRVAGAEPPADWALHVRPKGATVFNPAGLKVLFVLLARPEYLNRPYREIAKAAGVALGTVGELMERLKEMGYLVNLAAGRNDLRGRPKLIEDWVGAYALRVVPRYKVRRFHAENRDWWKNVELKPLGAFWGGDVAAFRLTGYLKPVEITIYTRANLVTLLQAHRMRADPKGEVRIVEPFWDFPANEGEGDNVPPLLVYADLMATGDPRAIETAQKILENHLA